MNLTIEGVPIQYFSGENYQQSPEDFNTYIAASHLALQGAEPFLGDPVDATGNAHKAWIGKQLGLWTTHLTGAAAEWNRQQGFAAETIAVRGAALIAQFQTDRGKFSAQAAAKEVHINDRESITGFATRVRKLVDIAWPDPAGAAGVGVNVPIRALKYREIFTAGLPRHLKRASTKQFLRNPDVTFPNLIIHIEGTSIEEALVNEEDPNPKKDSFEFQECINTLKKDMQTVKNKQGAITNEMDNIVNMNERENKYKYDPNKPRMNQNQRRFCKYCKESGHTIEFCYLRQKDIHNRPQTPPEKTVKFQDQFRVQRSNSLSPHGSSFNPIAASTQLVAPVFNTPSSFITPPNSPQYVQYPNGTQLAFDSPLSQNSMALFGGDRKSVV